MMTRTESGNPRLDRGWGRQWGVKIRQRRQPLHRRRKIVRCRSRRVTSRRRQRGRALISSIGNSTVDRAFQNMRGLAPEMIDRSADRLTRVGKELTDNAINQLIDIPKNRLKGVVR